MEFLKSAFVVFWQERTRPSLVGTWRSRQPVAWVLALAIGVLGAYAILAFREAIGLVQFLWLGSKDEDIVATLASFREPWLVVLAPTVGGLAVGLILTWLAPARRPEAISDVIEARALHGARISPKSGFYSAVVAAVSLGSGASAGREGPAVHLGATIASWLGSRFALPPQMRRVLLGCGAAAAVSASFNAPIAGVLFAHEVILGHYALSAFVPTVIASVAATLVTRAHLGDLPTFILPDYQIHSYWEFPAFALLGITCGIVAVVFQLSVITADWTARHVKMPLWLRPVTGGVLVGIIAIFVPEVLGVGYEATNNALRENYTIWVLFVLLASKTAATAITLASRFGGGVFSPSLYLGAMAGGAFGIIAGSIFPDYASGYGVYAILGMGAVAGAVLGAPLSSALIVFELTGGYEMTIALLLSVSISSIIMQVVMAQSFFTWQLSQRGLSLDDGPHRRIMRTYHVEDFLTHLTPEEQAEPADIPDDAPRLTTQDTLEVALRSFSGGTHPRLAVFDPNDMQKHIGWAHYTRALNTFNTALIAANVEEHR